MAGVPPQLYRGRTPSGHDIPIPESVFQAIAQVQAENAGTRAEVAGLRSDVAEVKEAVKKIAATNVDKWTNLLKVVVPAVVAIVGGTVGAQKLTAPAAPAPTVVYESALSAALVRCQGLPEAEQRFCREDAYEADRARRRGNR